MDELLKYDLKLPTLAVIVGFLGLGFYFWTSSTKDEDIEFDSFSGVNKENERTIWRMDKPGKVSSLMPLHNQEIDEIGENEVLIKVKAIGE